MATQSRYAAPVRQRALVSLPLSTRPDTSLLKPMLFRLQTALGCDDLMAQMVLVSKPRQTKPQGEPGQSTINVVVGFSGSPKSQAALDIALCIAHQTRMASQKPVVVHVVYVVDKTRPKTIDNADRILWQARCLASEWRGSLDAHLRIGQVATELSQVATELNAEVILVGCQASQHALVKQLAPQTPCSVLGVPQ